MNQDPTKIGRAKVSAGLIAEVVNSFVDPISWKTLVSRRPFLSFSRRIPRTHSTLTVKLRSSSMHPLLQYTLHLQSHLRVSSKCAPRISFDSPFHPPT